MFERQKYWDACAGVMVMWMITYHIFISAEIENCIQYTLFNIFYFFMPWFFFKAGVFWRKKPINVVIRNGLKRLGIPFVLSLHFGDTSFGVYKYGCRAIPIGHITYCHLSKHY